MNRLVLRHELIQEDFKGIDPDFNRRLWPVSLLQAHALLQDVFEQCVQILIPDTLTIIHLWQRRRRTHGVSECEERQKILFKNSFFFFYEFKSKCSRRWDSYSQGRGVGIEDIESKLFQSLLKHHVDRRVLLTVLSLKIIYLSHSRRIFRLKLWIVS